MSTAGRLEAPRAAGRAARRLLPIAGAYLPVVATGALLSFVYGVGARSGHDPRADIALRGTALAPPLFLPVAMVGGAALARAPGRGGTVGAAIAGGVGLAYLLGGTINLPNDLKAARAAGSPPALTAAMGATAAGFGLALAATAAAALGASDRIRKRARLARHNPRTRAFYRELWARARGNARGSDLDR